MSRIHPPAAHVLPVLALGLLVSAGCVDLPLSMTAIVPPSSRQAAADSPLDATIDRTALRAVLARSVEKDAKGATHSVWIRAINPTDGRRWRYGDLDALLAQSDQPQRSLARFLSDSDPTVTSNAAIGLARVGDASGAARLETTVRSPVLPVPMRSAAIEALSLLDDPAARKSLDGLLTRFGDAMDKPDYQGELHAEALRGVASRAGKTRDVRFVSALKSPAPEVKLEAIAAIHECGGPLPTEVADLRTHGDRRVRAAALRALVATGHTEAEAASLAALRDTELNVRLAAIECLGRLGGPSACDALKALMIKTEADRVRQAAAAALAVAGQRQAVFAATGDKSWRVRQEVAASLGTLGGDDSAAVARKLLDDPSAEVQRSTVTSVAAWPLEMSGPILLDAMERPAFGVRKQAAESLARKWPPAADFAVEAPPQRRSEMIAALRARLGREVVPRPAAADAKNPPAPEDRAQVDESLKQIAAADVQERRRGAERLATVATKSGLDLASLEQLASIASVESDPLVWQGVFSAIANSADEPAGRLACAALGHPSAEVRRRACEYFAVHPDSSRAAAIVPSLQDETEAVVCVAARALGAAGNKEAVEPLRRLLMARSEFMCLEAASALCRLGDPSGSAALERLSYSRDPQIQRKAAQAMGSLGDRAFAATLVRLLDGEASVQNAALTSLPKVVGRDVAAEGVPPRNTVERMHRWKEWLSAGGGMDVSASSPRQAKP